MIPLRAAIAAALLLVSAPALAEAKKALGPGDRIDLNRAGVTELMRLPGIGEKRAQAIVAARARQPFKRPEDVLIVKGIGPKWLAKVKDHVSVGGAPAASATTAAPAPKAAKTG